MAEKKKMTRAEALEIALASLYAEDMMPKEKADEVAEVLEKMLASINKQASRPRAKSSARIQNEGMAKQFIPMLEQYGKPVNTKWMMENIRYCISSQKAVKVAEIAIEWGKVEKVKIKGRTYYAPVGWVK